MAWCQLKNTDCTKRGCSTVHWPTPGVGQQNPAQTPSAVAEEFMRYQLFPQYPRDSEAQAMKTGSCVTNCGVHWFTPCYQLSSVPYSWRGDELLVRWNSDGYYYLLPYDTATYLPEHHLTGSVRMRFLYHPLVGHDDDDA